MTGQAPVTAIVPLFNGRRFIRQAIASIEAQTLPPSEILVIDDGSSDEGAALLDGIAGLTIIRQDNAGEGAARNRGVRAASQPLIAFLDQDDAWLPDKLRLQLAVLAGDPAIDIVFGRHRLIVDDHAGWFRRELLDRSLSARLPGTLLARRNVFERIGLFCEDMKLGSDVDWTWRAADAGLVFHLIEQDVLLRRAHQANASRDMAQFADGLLRAAQASLRRKRS
jgi:glycosyltransferase involved in cell wall biosynthesis